MTAEAFAPLRHLTVGGFREWLLAPEQYRRSASPKTAPGITPEMAAAVSKLMRNQDLVLVARTALPRRHPLSQHPRAPRAACLSAFSPTTPPTTSEGIFASMLDGLHVRQRRRGHRYQSGQR